MLLSLASTLIIAGVAARTFNFPLTFAALFDIVIPDIFNNDNNVDEPKTSILENWFYHLNY